MIRKSIHTAVIVTAMAFLCSYDCTTASNRTELAAGLDKCVTQGDSVRCILRVVAAGQSLDSLQMAWLMDALGRSVERSLAIPSGGYLNKDGDVQLLYDAIDSLATMARTNDTMLWALLSLPDEGLRKFAEIDEYIREDTPLWVLSNMRGTVRYYAAAGRESRYRLVDRMSWMDDEEAIDEFTSKIDSVEGDLRAPAVELRDSVLAGIRRLPKR